MAYASWSVVFGEQPSTAKWNILGTNDASFNDGTGIGTNAIAAASLSTTAIMLGFASITSNFTTTTVGSYVDVTSLAVTVTVPAGGRDLELVASVGAANISAGAGNNLSLAIREGSTALVNQIWNNPAANYAIPFTIVARVAAPSAGSHTYKVSASQSAAGTLTISAGAANPAYNSLGPAYIYAKMI